MLAMSDALKVELENYGQHQHSQQRSKIYLALKNFDPSKPQCVTNWKSLKSQFYENMIELMKGSKVMEENQMDDDIIMSILYQIGYGLIFECYEFMKEKKNKHNIYNPMVYNMIYLNLKTFYRLKDKNKSQKMLKNVYRFLDFIYDDIMKKMGGYPMMKEFDLDNDDVDSQNLKRMIHRFILECCTAIWSAIHYGYKIGPKFHDLQRHSIYNDKIHKKELESSDNVICFIFPALYEESDKYETDIWVMCE